MKAPTFAPVEVVRTPLAGGGFTLSASRPLGTPVRAVGDQLVAWAARAPDRVFLAERGPGGGWAQSTYAATLEAVRSLGQALLDLGLSATRPLMLLSGNSVDHALLQLAAMHVGIPVAPVSPAYSLQSKDFAKLKLLGQIVRPGAVFAADGALFAPAAAALALDVPWLVGSRPEGLGGRTVIPLATARGTRPGPAVDAAFATLTPDTLAKVLFTSGSTGVPKGVANTQRMLCANQQAIAEGWPFLAERPPVTVDWLPWTHTFGGNHNFFMVLWHGGSLFIDGGKPAPGAFDETVRNLTEVSPSVYFNVPRGFELLVSRLEKDEALRTRFFADLQLLFYAAAALPESTWKRLEAVSRLARGTPVTMVSAWGLTETSPLVTQVHSRIERTGNIGVPARGCELAFVPNGQKLELRVKGPNVTPGYWSAETGVVPLPVDAQGFFATGDAGRLADENDPNQGVLFDGRIAENFKLATGTWVHVGELRVGLIAALAPLVSDAVITGHDRDELGCLLFLSPDAAGHARLDTTLRERLVEFNARRAGASSVIKRARVLSEPPQIDAGEITDKGYLNQRAILERRAGDVERLYAGGAGVIVV